MSKDVKHDLCERCALVVRARELEIAIELRKRLLGNDELLLDIHRHWGDAKKYEATVGKAKDALCDLMAESSTIASKIGVHDRAQEDRDRLMRNAALGPTGGDVTG